MKLPTEIPTNAVDHAAVTSLLAAASAVFGAGCRHLPDADRPELLKMLRAGWPLDLKLRMLPNPFIEVTLELPDGQERMLFSMPLAIAPVDPGPALN